MNMKKILVGLGVLTALICCAPKQVWPTVSNTGVSTTTGYGNGTNVNFTITFDFRSNSWLTVTRYDTSTSPVTVTQIPQQGGSLGFTVSGGNPGTTVVMGTAPSLTQYLIISRAVPLTQPVVFNPASIFPYQGISAELDQMTLALQNINAAGGPSTVSGSGGSGGGGSVGGLPSPGAAYDFIGWNAAGASTVNATTVYDAGQSTFQVGDMLQFNGTGWSTYAFTQSGLMQTLNGSPNTPLAAASGGSGVTNTSNFSWGSHPITLTTSGTTTLTLPTSGTVITGTATNNNVANTLVSRDSSGNFSSNAISANSFVGPLTGNVTGNVTGNTSGTAANVTGIVAVGNGGTGQTTQQAAVNALLNTSGSSANTFARYDGSNVTLAAIGITDVPQGFSRSKLAQGTANTIVVNDASGNMSVLTGGTSGNCVVFNGVAWASAACGGGGSGSGISYGADTGTVNAFVVNPSTPIGVYTAGLAVSFLAANANTGAATINVSGQGTQALTTPSGVALTAGDILAGQIVTAVYDGTQFQMISPEGPAFSDSTANALVKRNSSGFVTTPTLLGGTGVGSALTLQSTSGVGTTDSISFNVGNNGATQAMNIIDNGFIGIGTTIPPTTVLQIGGDRSAPAWSTNGISFRINPATYTDTTTSGVINLTFDEIGIPTYAASNTVTALAATTFRIDGAPVAGNNATVTKGYALGIASGSSYFGGPIAVGQNGFNPLALVDINGNQSFASWTTMGKNLAVETNTLTDNSGSGTIATRASNSLGIPTFAASSSETITNAANLYIAGAPVAGANTTISGSEALYVAGGTSYFGGNVGVGTTAPLHALDVNGDCVSLNGSCLGVSSPTNVVNYTGSELIFSTTTALADALTRFMGAHGTALATTDTDGIVVSQGGFLQNFFVKADANTVNGNTVFTLFKNTVSTGVSVTLGAAATSASDTSTTLAVTAGDRISIQVATGGSSGSITRPMFTSSLILSTNVFGSQWGTSGSNVYYTAGNVGIGTSTPTATLQVSGTASLGTISAGTWNASTISPAYGGTGISSPTAHQVPIAEGAGNFTFATPSTAGFVMTSNGTAADPTFQTEQIQAAAYGSALANMSTFQARQNQLTQTGTGRQFLETSYRNLLANPSFEAATFSTNWSSSTISVSSSASTVDGIAAMQINYSAQKGGINQSVTPTVQTLGQNWAAWCKVNTTMTNVEVCALTGGTNVACSAVPATGTWQTVLANFVGPANGTSMGVDVDSAVTGTGTVLVDDCHIEPAPNIGTTPLVTPWDNTLTFTPTNFGTVSNVTFWSRRVGDSLQVRGYFTAGTLTGSAVSIGLPSSITIDSTKLSAGNSIQSLGGLSYRLNSGEAIWANNDAYATFYDGSTTNAVFLSSSSSATKFSKLQGSIGAGDTVPVEFTIPVQQFGSLSTFISTDQSDYGWTAYTPTLGAGFGTTTNVSFFQKRIGDTLYVQGFFTAGTVAASSASISLPSGLSIDTTKVSTSNTTSNPGTMIGTYGSDGSSARSGPLVTATGTSTSLIYMGLNYSNAAVLTPTTGSGTIVSNSNNSVFFSVPIASWQNSNRAPQLIGSVTNTAPNGSARIDAAQVTCSSSSSIGSQLNGGSWVSSIGNISSGACSVTLAGGEFSSTPYCWTDLQTSSANQFLVHFSGTSSTAATVSCTDNATIGTACTTFTANIFCIGAR